jgi:hypothetical protein
MPETAEPVYPLSKAAFTRALMTGQGRALIHAERCGTEGLRGEILNAALFPNVYDAQCNGLGEDWLARLCQAAGLVESFISQDHGIAGDLELRCGMLAQFARMGHAAPRAELRELCRYDEEKDWLIAAEEIVEIDGEDGFVFAADRAGEAILKHPDYWGDPGLASLLDEKAGEGRAMAIMDRESPGNPNIAAFRKAVLKDQKEKKFRPDQTVPTVDELIGQILTSTKRIGRLSYFGKNGTPEERLKVAGLDFARMTPVSLDNYLFYFSRSGFPEFREEHLPLLRHPEERIRWWALSALSHHAEPQVRQAAYQALARGEPAFFVKLLRCSGLPEDTEPLLVALGPPGTMADADEEHGVGYALLDLATENPKMGDPRLPLWIVETTPCRICRFHAVELMASRAILPDWIAEECLFDAYENTREIAAKHLGVERKF